MDYKLILGSMAVGCDKAALLMSQRALFKVMRSKQTNAPNHLLPIRKNSLCQKWVTILKSHDSIMSRNKCKRFHRNCVNERRLKLGANVALKLYKCAHVAAAELSSETGERQCFTESLQRMSSFAIVAPVQ